MTVGRPQGEAEDIRNFRMSPSNGRDVKNNWKIMYEVNAKANNIIKVVPTMNLDNAFKTKSHRHRLFLPRVRHAVALALLR